MPVPSQSTAGQTKRAVLYLRMSTERQKYSIENQSCVLYAYAVEHGLVVVDRFCDEAKSGLTFEGRPAMRKLIELVKVGNCGFECILTYDVSRWGRFQDADESAYYEHLCTHAGVRVIYCAEVFDSYEGPIAFVMKSLKRTFAAEYSRDLSQRISDAKWRLAKEGLYTGSRAPCALRRLVISRNDAVVGAVEDGFLRRHPGDRIVVRPGPKSEQAIVRRIFREFAKPHQTITGIARDLNKIPATCLKGRKWTAAMVRRALADERYIGNMVFRSYHQRGLVGDAKTPTQVVRHDAAFKPIVPVSQFHAATERLRKGRRRDDATLLERLRSIYAKNGKIAMSLLGHENPCSSVYRRRFGSLLEAYRAAGVEPAKNVEWIARQKLVIADQWRTIDAVAAQLRNENHSVAIDYKNALLNVDGAWGIHIRLLCARTKEGSSGWQFSITDKHRTDLLLLLRLDEAGCRMEDMYLVPMLSIRRKPKGVSMGSTNNVGTDMYRIHGIAEISALAERYLNDVDDCMPHFGRTLKDLNRGGFERHRPAKSGKF